MNTSRADRGRVLPFFLLAVVVGTLACDGSSPTASQQPASLAFRVEPSDVVAGRTFDPEVQVEVLDDAGNPVEDADIPITLSVGTNPADGSLGGTKTVNAVSGVARFSTSWIDKAGSGYTLTASASRATDATSTTFEVVAGPPASLAFVSQPATSKVGTVLPSAVEVEIRDEFGNPTDATNPVTVSLEDNVAGAELTGTSTVDAVAGLATFSDLAVDDPGDGLTIRASSGDLDEAVSQPFAATLRIYAASLNTDLYVLEASTNSVVTSIPVGSGLRTMALTPDGARAYVPLFDVDSAAVVDLAGRSVAATFAVGSNPGGVAVAPDGGTAYVSNRGSAEVTVIDVSSDVVTGSIAVPPEPLGMDFAEDGAALLVAHTTDSLSVVDPASGAVVQRNGSAQYATDVTVSPGDEKVYVSGFFSNLVGSHSPASGYLQERQFEVGGAPQGIAFSPDGREAYVANSGSNNVAIVNSAGDDVVDWVGVPSPPHYIAVSPGGGLLYVTHSAVPDAPVSVVSTETREVVATIPVGERNFGIAVEPVP